MRDGQFVDLVALWCFRYVLGDLVWAWRLDILNLLLANSKTPEQILSSQTASFYVSRHQLWCTKESTIDTTSKQQYWRGQRQRLAFLKFRALLNPCHQRVLDESEYRFLDTSPWRKPEAIPLLFRTECFESTIPAKKSSSHQALWYCNCWIRPSVSCFCFHQRIHQGSCSRSCHKRHHLISNSACCSFPISFLVLWLFLDPISSYIWVLNLIWYRYKCRTLHWDTCYCFHQIFELLIPIILLYSSLLDIKSFRNYTITSYFGRNTLKFNQYYLLSSNLTRMRLKPPSSHPANICSKLEY